MAIARTSTYLATLFTRLFDSGDHQWQFGISCYSSDLAGIGSEEHETQKIQAQAVVA